MKLTYTVYMAFPGSQIWQWKIQHLASFHLCSNRKLRLEGMSRTAILAIVCFFMLFLRWRKDPWNVTHKPACWPSIKSLIIYFDDISQLVDHRSSPNSTVTSCNMLLPDFVVSIICTADSDLLHIGSSRNRALSLYNGHQ